MNFDELSKRFGQKVQDTVSEVQKMSEIRQLNTRINDEKRQIKSVFTEIGTKVYELYKDAPLEGLDVLFDEIKECEEAIADYEQQILDIRHVRVCPNCKAEVSLTGKFCSECGAELPPAEPEKEEEEVAEADAAAETAEEAVEEAADVVEETAEEAADVVDEVAEEAADVVDEVAEEAADVIDGAVDTVQEAASEAAEAVKEAFETTGE